MNKELIDFINYLYNDYSIDKAFEKLENELHITKYESICDFEEELTSNLKDFKSEILDYLLILLAQLKDIQQIKEVFDRFNTIQCILKKYLKEVAEADFEAREAKDIEEEKELLKELYGYKPQPDELPYYTY